MDEFLEILRVCLKDYLEYSVSSTKSESPRPSTTMQMISSTLSSPGRVRYHVGHDAEREDQGVFGIFDFDESGLLSVDEMILSRTAISAFASCRPLTRSGDRHRAHRYPGVRDFKSIDGSMINRDRFANFAPPAPKYALAGILW